MAQYEVKFFVEADELGEVAVNGLAIRVHEAARKAGLHILYRKVYVCRYWQEPEKREMVMTI